MHAKQLKRSNIDESHVYCWLLAAATSHCNIVHLRLLPSPLHSHIWIMMCQLGVLKRFSRQSMSEQLFIEPAYRKWDRRRQAERYLARSILQINIALWHASFEWRPRLRCRCRRESIAPEDVQFARSAMPQTTHRMQPGVMEKFAFRKLQPTNRVIITINYLV